MEALINQKKSQICHIGAAVVNECVTSCRVKINWGEGKREEGIHEINTGAVSGG